MKRYTITETAKLIRSVLKNTYPKTKFSVTSSRYSMGCSIRVSWTDGPRHRDVGAILDKFEGAGFDGMTDCKTYNSPSEWNGEACEFGVDYVQGSRHESEALLQIAAYRVHKETKLPLLEIRDGSARNGEYQVKFNYIADMDVIAHGESQRICGGEWYSQLVYQVARNIATEEPTTKPSLPQMVTPEFIAATVKTMIV